MAKVVYLHRFVAKRCPIVKQPDGADPVLDLDECYKVLEFFHDCIGAPTIPMLETMEYIDALRK